MSIVATKRGPYARTRLRREEIASAVLEIVERSGHENVTISDVAERANTPEATVLYHFPSRDHLLISALELADQRSLAEVEVIDGGITLSLEDLRDSLLEPRLHSQVNRLLLVLQGQAATPDHPAVAYFSARNASQLRIFSQLIAKRQRDGYAHPALDPDTVARQFIALFGGLATLQLTDASFNLADTLLDAYRRLAGENIVEIQKNIAAAGFGV